MNSTFIPPWDKEDAFPEKPPCKNYGYVLRGKFIECSREELIEKCRSRDLPQVHLVWCPEFSRIVPVAAVEFLSEALQDRSRGESKSTIGIGVFCLFIWGSIGLLAGSSSHRPFAWAWMLVLAITTGLIPVVSGVYNLIELKNRFATPTPEEIAVERYNAWVVSRRILLTWLLLGGIGGVFSLECIYGFPESANAAGLDKHAVWRGEWWRLFTAPLLHANAMHFIFNASALIGLGRLMEVLTSRYYLVLVFAVAALTGSLFSLILLPGETSVGASGGLLGLIGFLTILGIRRKQLLPPNFAKSMAINVALLAAMGIVAFSFIDNAAHLGGFIAGIVLGIFLVNKNDQSIPLETNMNVKIAGIVALILVFSFVGFSLMRLAHGKF